VETERVTIYGTIVVRGKGALPFELDPLHYCEGALFLVRDYLATPSVPLQHNFHVCLSTGRWSLTWQSGGNKTERYAKGSGKGCQSETIRIKGY
jgi:hypothetical protein